MATERVKRLGTKRVERLGIKRDRCCSLCEQKVVKRAKLTHVTFNPTASVLLVGDDKGGVISLKLSPNLRQIVSTADLGKSEELQALWATNKEEHKQCAGRTGVGRGTRNDGASIEQGCTEVGLLIRSVLPRYLFNKLETIIQAADVVKDPSLLQ